VAEARYLAWPKINDQLHYPVKGNFLNFDLMLANPKWSKIFDQGPMMIARLCPVDYHRFHYPDDGNVIEHWRVQGDLHSVNPLALKYKNDIFCQNERVVSILKTQNFGHLAYIEVGATCVGKIIQSHAWEKSFKRGDEKGYFLFGGSTVILIGEKGKWLPSEDLLSNTQKEIETWVPIGTSVGELLS
jgi:phosphatidylserine decarboxylase